MAKPKTGCRFCGHSHVGETREECDNWQNTHHCVGYTVIYRVGGTVRFEWRRQLVSSGVPAELLRHKHGLERQGYAGADCPAGRAALVARQPQHRATHRVRGLPSPQLRRYRARTLR